MTAKQRHVNTWRFLRRAAGGVLRAIFRYDCEIVEPEARPYLVVANHNTDLDPALVGLSFPEQMYFVASEHVFRKGFGSWLLRTFFAPISRMKGATDAQAALDIIRALRRGDNVCLFAEGNRSFNGVTGPAFPATGKLAKASGATLVTYHITGGYLTTPRWSHTMRHGRMHGACVHVYTPEQLKAMRPEEVNAHIAEDLFEDAFARQQSEPVRYAGKRLAEGLENALFLCPKCGRVGTLKSEGDRFFCDCGLTVRYTEYGFFEGEDAPFSTVRDWDAWQEEALQRLAADGVSFTDADMTLKAVNARHRMKKVDCGTLFMDRERLTLGSASFPLADISGFAVIGANKLMFSAGGGHYEICADGHGYCGRKYFLLYQIDRQKG